ncbi:hypothetical protein [Mycobacterium sp. 852002-40037_SCH5390672]|uniref:hypothetical protein n=1 Tax=Mycobacterium sp. 852002-40037_SCH5390672 TaxID=1834089 RepID=UPI0008050D1A|nr:hypothetical protein [Mycobacterium sp. 852002-40037_SCH5390672]OBC01374.1 hypothetical protein A5782_20205 [Mycobacterium sp. 852002-40037_SCH5390672]
MRFIYVVVAVGIAIAVLFVAPAVLISASARADFSGYTNCVGSITEVPLWEHDSQNMQLVGVIEQDLNSGVSRAAETQKVAQMGFDARLANSIVECVIQEHP